MIAFAAPRLASADTFAAGSAAAPWLKLPNSARVAAMGEAAVATRGDVNSLSENPAGLADLNGIQASLFHHAYVVDTSVEHAALGMSVGEHGGAALGVDYLNFGSVDRYSIDAGGNLVAGGSFNPNSLAIQAGYGQALGAFSLGANLMMVSQSLDGSSSSSAFGVDVGALWRQNRADGLSAGLSVQNFGTQLDGADLPGNFKAGIAYKLGLPESKNALLFALDGNLPSADAGAGTVNLGAEFSVASFAALRGGYKIAGNGGASGLSAGGGVAYSIASVDYAFVSEGALGNSNEVSLTLKF